MGATSREGSDEGPGAAGNNVSGMGAEAAEELFQHSHDVHHTIRATRRQRQFYERRGGRITIFFRKGDSTPGAILGWGWGGSRSQLPSKWSPERVCSRVKGEITTIVGPYQRASRWEYCREALGPAYLCQFLTAFPSWLDGTELRRRMTRQSVLEVQPRPILHMTHYYNGCGAKMTVEHSLKCKVSNIVHIRHDDMDFQVLTIGRLIERVWAQTKKLATFLSKKWKRGYWEMVFYIKVRMTIVVVQANNLLIHAAGVIRNLVVQTTLIGSQCTIGGSGRRGERPLAPTRECSLVSTPLMRFPLRKCRPLLVQQGSLTNRGISIKLPGRRIFKNEQRAGSLCPGDSL